MSDVPSDRAEPGGGKRVILAMPVYRDVDIEAVKTLGAFCLSAAPAGWKNGFIIGRGQPVSLMREKLAVEGLFEAEADIVVYLDSDVSLSSLDPVWNLARHLDAAPPEVGLLGVAVPMQQQGPQHLNVHPLVGPVHPPMPQPIAPTTYQGLEPQSPYMEAAAIGFGCVAIRREAFLSLDRPWFTFDTDPENENRFRGEDVTFCDRIRAAGFHVWVDFSVLGSHWYRTEHKGAAPFAPPDPVTTRLERP